MKRILSLVFMLIACEAPEQNLQPLDLLHRAEFRDFNPTPRYRVWVRGRFICEDTQESVSAKNLEVYEEPGYLAAYDSSGELVWECPNTSIVTIGKE